MEVELHRTLLTARPREDLVLLAICAFGSLGRHRIVPDDRAVWDGWAATLPPNLAAEVRLAWDEGERRASEGGPSELVAVVPTGPANFGQTPIVLTPEEALALLGRPMLVLLENGRNDRAFVLAFADEATRRMLEEAEADGWVVFVTASVRGFIDMKHGRQHQNNIRTVDSVWNALDVFQQAALLDGFGSGFSASFYGSQRGLQDETGEISALLATIMERI